MKTKEKGRFDNGQVLLSFMYINCRLSFNRGVYKSEKEKEKERKSERTESGMNKNDLYIRLFD